MGVVNNGTPGDDNMVGSDGNIFIFNKDDTLSGQTLVDQYARLIAGKVKADLGDHAVF